MGATPTFSLLSVPGPLLGPGVAIENQVDPGASLQSHHKADQLLRVLAHQLLKVPDQQGWRKCWNRRCDDETPDQKHTQSHGCSNQWTMGPDRAMGDQSSVGPPQEAERSPAP